MKTDKDKDMIILAASYYAMLFQLNAYHWHYRGDDFFAIHAMTESQYKQMNDMLDELSEIAIMMKYNIPHDVAHMHDQALIDRPKVSGGKVEVIKNFINHYQALIGQIIKILEGIDDSMTMKPLSDLISNHLTFHHKCIWQFQSMIV